MATAVLTTDLVNFALGESADAGTWSGGKSSLYDTVTYKQGTGSRQYICNSTNTYDMIFTKTASVNIGTSSVIRVWAMITDAFRCGTKASGAIRIAIGDGTNTGYWNYDGSDTYDGGWKQFVVDTGTTPSSGTSPNFAAITVIGISVTYASIGKNTPTVWIDAIRYGNAIVATGGTSGDEIGLEEIYTTDHFTTYHNMVGCTPCHCQIHDLLTRS